MDNLLKFAASSKCARAGASQAVPSQHADGDDYRRENSAHAIARARRNHMHPEAVLSHTYFFDLSEFMKRSTPSDFIVEAKEALSRSSM
jgi:hypothetical protein